MLQFSKSLWPKQVSESQADALGSQILTLRLVGKDKEVLVQDKGKPVIGMIPADARLILKLLAAAWDSGPTTQKGRGYLETLAINSQVLNRVLANSKKAGLSHLEVEWAKSRLYAEIDQLVQWALSSLRVIESTSKRFPGVSQVVPDQEVETKEEVQIEL